MDPAENQPTSAPASAAAAVAAAGPTSTLDSLPEELIIRILDFALARDTPFDLEGCVDLLRNGLYPLHNGSGHTEPFPGFTFHPHEPRDRDVREYPEWHRVHLQDWLMVNATCRRFRRLGHQLYFRNRTFVVSQLLPGKLKYFEDRGFGPSGDDRPLYHPLLLEHVQEIVLVNINSVSASKFLKIPAFVKSFPNLKTCTLQLDYRPDDHMDQLKNAVVVEGDDDARRVPATLRKLLVDIGMDESIKLRLALYEIRAEESWHETIVRENVFPMLRQRKRMMSHATQAR